MKILLFNLYFLFQCLLIPFQFSAPLNADVVAFSGALIGIPVLILVAVLAIVTAIIIRVIYKKNK